MPNRLSLVAQLRASIALIALLALIVASLSAYALYKIGREREALINDSLNTLLDLDVMKSQLPAIVASVLNGDGGSAELADGFARIGQRAERLSDPGHIEQASALTDRYDGLTGLARGHGQYRSPG